MFFPFRKDFTKEFKTSVLFAQSSCHTKEYFQNCMHQLSKNCATATCLISDLGWVLLNTDRAAQSLVLTTEFATLGLNQNTFPLTSVLDFYWTLIAKNTIQRISPYLIPQSPVTVGDLSPGDNLINIRIYLDSFTCY